MRLIVLLIIAFSAVMCEAQNIIIQQNNASTPKTVEKVKVVEVEKEATKPSSPVCLMGYLYVFPEAIESTTSDIDGVVWQLNQHRAYGSNKWRVADIGELKLVLSHADKLPGIANRPLMYISSTLEEISYSGNQSCTWNKCVDRKLHYGAPSESAWTGHFIIIRTE